MRVEASLLVSLLVITGKVVAVGCAPAAADVRVPGPTLASLSCRQVVEPAGDRSVSAVLWHDQEDSRPALDAWCRGVGPVVYQSQPEPGAESAPLASTGPIGVVSWNVNVGAGDLSTLVADLRAGVWSDGRRVDHFVVLLQEALRTGETVPRRGPSQAGSRRLLRKPPRVDIVRFAREFGLSLLYVPSMRNGLDADAPAEDRGNAILSTLPLLAPAALELPFVRQRRVVVLAMLGGMEHGETLWVASVHLDHFVGASRLWVFGTAGARGRQARAVATVLPQGPFVVGGDFNTWLGTDEPALREMTRAGGHTMPARGGTYSSGAILDYLFFRTPASWQATYERAGNTYGSDHYPLVGWITP